MKTYIIKETKERFTTYALTKVIRWMIPSQVYTIECVEDTEHEECY